MIRPIPLLKLLHYPEFADVLQEMSGLRGQYPSPCARKSCIYKCSKTSQAGRRRLETDQVTQYEGVLQDLVSDPNPLHLIKRDLIAGTVIELRGPR